MCEWNNIRVWCKTYCSYLTQTTCETSPKSRYYSCKRNQNSKTEIRCREKWSGKTVWSENCNWLLQPFCKDKKSIVVYLQGRCVLGLNDCTANLNINNSNNQDKFIQMQTNIPGITTSSPDPYYGNLSQILPELKRGDSIQINELRCKGVKFWTRTFDRVTVSLDQNITKQAIDFSDLNCSPANIRPFP